MTHWRKSKAITCSQGLQTNKVNLMTNLALCPEDFRDCSLEAQEEKTRGMAR